VFIRKLISLSASGVESDKIFVMCPLEVREVYSEGYRISALKVCLKFHHRSIVSLSVHQPSSDKYLENNPATQNVNLQFSSRNCLSSKDCAKLLQIHESFVNIIRKCTNICMAFQVKVSE
jgi:hypothetical protein